MVSIMIDEVQKFEIEGLILIKPHVFQDSRGYFYESYNKSELKELGINANFIKDNESKSCKNVVRGLHLQIKNSQAKLARCTKGAIFDVAVDLRKDSKTFGKWQGVILSEENKNLFYIPKGFAHGFAVISDEAVFSYKCDGKYSPKYERGLIWNDEELNINWKDYIDINNVILSEKDKHHPSLNDWRLGRV